MRSLVALILFASAATVSPCLCAGADEQAEEAKEKPIATVLDKPIFLKDIVVDEKDKTPLRDYFAIADHIWGPLEAKFVKDHHLAATPEEIADFHKAVNLAVDGPREKAPARDADNDKIATYFVLMWKFNKALHDKYGGRVIFQQGGPEPLDAYRDWLRDEEKLGHFSIDDPKWRTAFWEYTKPKYHVFVDEPEPFKQPFWKKLKDKEDCP